MKRNKLLEWLGFSLIANHNTKEIHDMSHISGRCRLYWMRNANYISQRKAKKLYENDYNGCRYCNKNKDNG